MPFPEQDAKVRRVSSLTPLKPSACASSQAGQRGARPEMKTIRILLILMMKKWVSSLFPRGRKFPRGRNGCRKGCRSLQPRRRKRGRRICMSSSTGGTLPISPRSSGKLCSDWVGTRCSGRPVTTPSCRGASSMRRRPRPPQRLVWTSPLGCTRLFASCQASGALMDSFPLPRASHSVPTRTAWSTWFLPSILARTASRRVARGCMSRSCSCRTRTLSRSGARLLTSPSPSLGCCSTRVLSSMLAMRMERHH
mmetsp:Transcript_100522/g.322600  ORF Transcript_100522/g.322600 Transcript_100522/m.322600 type:complete len:252 (+) Transcript_100522:3114-3869(+)